VAILHGLTAALQEGDLPLHHAQHHQVLFHSDRIYRHSTCSINYTSYDVRREQDMINPNTSRCDVMCLQKGRIGSGHYVYARVLGIYHVNVVYTGPGSTHTDPRRFDFLWVRWFDSSQAPSSHLSLQCVSFQTVASGPDKIDFLDPDDVLRAAHILPRFFKGRKHGLEAQASSSDESTSDGSESDEEGKRTVSKPPVRCAHLACQPLRGAVTRCFISRLADEETDWNEYFVNWYVVLFASKL
jgi:hypothetical protein